MKKREPEKEEAEHEDGFQCDSCEGWYIWGHTSVHILMNKDSFCIACSPHVCDRCYLKIIRNEIEI
jgi:hypothetical protein